MNTTMQKELNNDMLTQPMATRAAEWRWSDGTVARFKETQMRPQDNEVQQLREQAKNTNHDIEQLNDMVQQLAKTIYGDHGLDSQPGLCEVVDWTKQQVFIFAEEHMRRDCPELNDTIKDLHDRQKKIWNEVSQLMLWRDSDDVRHKI